MSTFAQTAKAVSNKTVNDCGIPAYVSTGSELLDYFSKSGALRGNDAVGIKLFTTAFNSDDRELALATLLYTRDPRNGLGERQHFRAIISDLAKAGSKAINFKKLIELIPTIGRFDDLEVFFDTPYEADTISFICSKLREDLKMVSSRKKEKTVSLAAKWAPTENCSSKRSKQLAAKIRNGMNMTPKEYRKTLVKIRKHLNLVESNLSQKTLDKIDYAAVPSKANLLYKNAFLRNDTERRRAFLASLKKGETKINASVTYPYEISSKAKTSYDDTLEQLWKALPNYVEGESSVLIMADVSPSMRNFTGNVKVKSYAPIDMSMSLAIYFAERNKGPYKDLFMTFSDKPKFMALTGSNNLYSKMQKTNEGVGYSTNLAGAFDEILKHAIKHDVKKTDMPKALVVISDMQMNQGGNVDCSMVKAKFKKAGYTPPVLVWWNVNASDSNPDYSQDGVVFVSGASPTVFKSLLLVIQNKKVNPMDQVKTALENYIPLAKAILK